MDHDIIAKLAENLKAGILPPAQPRDNALPAWWINSDDWNRQKSRGWRIGSRSSTMRNHRVLMLPPAVIRAHLINCTDSPTWQKSTARSPSPRTCGQPTTSSLL